MNLETSLLLDSEFLNTKIAFLITRAVKISERYDSVMSRACQVEEKHERLSKLAENNGQLMGVIEFFMRDDVRACTVKDYVIVFIRLILAKMRRRGHDFDDVKQLFNSLSDESVDYTFRTVLSKLSFPDSERAAIRTVVESLQHCKWPVSPVLTTSPGGDAQISTALLYLRMQRDLDPHVTSALQRALCTAHECVVSDMAVSEVSCDVNLNANDVTSNHDDAYVDARVKYEDYVDFSATAAAVDLTASTTRDLDDSWVSSTASGRDCYTHGGGTPDDDDDDDGDGNEDNDDVASAKPKVVKERNRRRCSRGFIGVDEDEVINEICKSFEESCVISPDPSFCSSDSFSNASETAPQKNADKLHSAVHNQSLSSSCDDSSFGGDGGEKDGSSFTSAFRSKCLDMDPKPDVYRICYDASASTSQSDSAGEDAEKGSTNDIARHVQHVTKIANGKPKEGSGKNTTDAATETEAGVRIIVL